MMTVKSRFLSANRQSKIRRTNLCLCALAAISLLLVACDVELRKTDAQLGLNPQQAAGRHIFDKHCERCHTAYSTHGKNLQDFQSIFCIWCRLQVVASDSALADHLGWVSRDPADRTNTAFFGCLGGWRYRKPGRAASNLFVLA